MDIRPFPRYLQTENHPTFRVMEAQNLTVTLNLKKWLILCTARQRYIQYMLYIKLMASLLLIIITINRVDNYPYTKV